MSETLGQKQRRFTRMIGQVGQRVGYSSANSLHKERLTVDFNLFKDSQTVS